MTLQLLSISPTVLTSEVICNGSDLNDDDNNDLSSSDLQVIFDTLVVLPNQRTRNLLSTSIRFNKSGRRIFLTRHGESVFNTLGKIGGDSALSERGESYAKLLAKWISEKQNKTHSSTKTICWTSTLKRTQLTSRHLNMSREKQAKGCLDEINAGGRDGLTYNEIKMYYPQEYAQRDQNKLRYRYPDGESYLDVLKRLLPILSDINQSESDIVIVSHQATLRCLYSLLMGVDFKDTPFLSIPLHTVIELRDDGLSDHFSEQRFRL